MRNALLTLLFAVPLLAQGVQSRQPWQWTEEERVAARYAGAPQDHRAAPDGENTPPVVSYELSGKERPELFMPFELFDSLIKGVDADPLLRTRGREKLDPVLVSLGFNDPAAFWNDLNTIAKPYLAARREQGHPPSARYASIDAVVCAARFDALAKARQRFGRVRFDQLLYTAIAPGLVRSEATSYPDPSDMLLYQARGCR